jgi:uncharacterized protein YbaR (Trm112 family)
MDDSFLARLQCPICKSTLAVAGTDMLKSLNERIEKRQLVNHGGDVIENLLDSALINRDESFAYPMQEMIPTMIAERAIPLDQLANDQLAND